MIPAQSMTRAKGEKMRGLLFTLVAFVMLTFAGAIYAMPPPAVDVTPAVQNDIATSAATEAETLGIVGYGPADREIKSIGVRWQYIRSDLRTDTAERASNRERPPSRASP